MPAPFHAASTPPSDFGRARLQAQRAAAADSWISRNVRSIERWVAWSIAVYTAWVTVIAFPQEPSAWVLVLYAGLVGKWAEARGARLQWEMAGRGLALIAGAFVLQITLASQVAEMADLFFFWLSITCLCYAFMLRPIWGAIVVACAVIVFAAGSLQASPAPSTSELISRASFLVIFPLLLTMKFGAVMRRPDETLESARIDSSTALYNTAGFAAYGDEMLAECRSDDRPLSVVVFDCADLLEVRAVYGNRTARQLADHIVHQLSALAVDRGLAARTGPAEFSVVLPDMGHEKALAAIHSVLGEPVRFEMDAGHSEIVLVPGFMVECAGTDTESVEELHDEMRRVLARQQVLDLRHQLHMKRVRDRRSRPMDIAGRAVAA